MGEVCTRVKLTDAWLLAGCPALKYQWGVAYSGVYKVLP